MRFTLIDQVVPPPPPPTPHTPHTPHSPDHSPQHSPASPPTTLTAIKAVSTAEEYLGDHFPGFAVLPGVMMLETLVQAARLLLADDAYAGRAADRLILAEVKNLRYGNMVRPGEHLRVEVTLRNGDATQGWELQGMGKVGEKTAVQGRFRLTGIPA